MWWTLASTFWNNYRTKFHLKVLLCLCLCPVVAVGTCGPMYRHRATIAGRTLHNAVRPQYEESKWQFHPTTYFHVESKICTHFLCQIHNTSSRWWSSEFTFTKFNQFKHLTSNLSQLQSHPSHNHLKIWFPEILAVPIYVGQSPQNLEHRFSA